MRIPVAVSLGILLGSFAIDARAHADDPAAASAEGDTTPQIKALLTEIDAAIAAKDDANVVTAVKKAPPLYKGSVDLVVRGQLLKSLGLLVKQTKLSAARRAALAAIVGTDDSKEGYKILQPLYPKNDVEDPDRFNVAIVKAIGALAPDAAILSLIETYKKAKQLELSAEAVLALGNYGGSRQREKVLDEIYRGGKTLIPSIGTGVDASPDNIDPRKRSGDATAERWSAVGPSMGKALDALTGDTISNTEEWFRKIADTKDRRLLFKK